MSKKAKKIVSIDIELEDFEPIHLKMDEAKELYEQLHDLFGDKDKDVQHHYYPWYNRPYYTWYNAVGAVPLNNTITLSGASDTLTKVSSSNTNMTVAYNTA